MSENFANNYSTAIDEAGGIDSSQTAFDVLSVSGAPAVNFRIKVENELMLVTGIASNTLTVTRGIEGTTAAAHDDGTLVTHVLTAAVLADGLNPAFARYVRTGANYTTTSATFVDIDGTNLSLTITTRNRPVLCVFWGAAFVNNTAGELAFDIMVDGVAQGGTFGLQYLQQHSVASESMNPSFSYMTGVLSAGSHTFKMRWRVNNAAHTATLYGGTGGINSGFAVREI